jgi:hypothetical protein
MSQGVPVQRLLEIPGAVIREYSVLREGWVPTPLPQPRTARQARRERAEEALLWYPDPMPEDYPLHLRRYREVLVLYLRGLSYRDISQRMGYCYSRAADSHICRALAWAQKQEYIWQNRGK